MQESHPPPSLQLTFLFILMADFIDTDPDLHDDAELDRAEGDSGSLGSIKISAGHGRSVFFYVALAIKLLGTRPTLTLTGIGKGPLPARPLLSLVS